MNPQGFCTPMKIHQQFTTARDGRSRRFRPRGASAAVVVTDRLTTAVVFVGLILALMVLRSPESVFVVSFSFRKASLRPEDGVLGVTLDRSRFLSSIAFGSLLFPQAVHGDSSASQTPNNNRNANKNYDSNPRYIEENLPMTYGMDRAGNPRSREIFVRRVTGDATPYDFPVRPRELSRTWPSEWPFSQTDFLRSDGNDDAWFFEVPRLVYHIDEPSAAALTQYYRSKIPPRSEVLDLGSSWVSHYPLEFPKTMKSIRGTGMNALELSFNDQLTGGYEVLDLNGGDDPKLPYADDSLDVVTCAVSIEYLVQPVQVLREVHRVLRPGGRVIVSQSNRCFPSKTIAMWLGMNDAQHLELINACRNIPTQKRYCPPRLAPGYFQYAGGFEPRKAFDITATLPNNGRSDPLYVIEAVKSKKLV